MFNNDKAHIENIKREEQMKLDIAREQKEIRNIKRERFMLSPTGRVINALGVVGKGFSNGLKKIVENRNQTQRRQTVSRVLPQNSNSQRVYQRRPERNDVPIKRMSFLPETPPIMMRGLSSFSDEVPKRRNLI